MLATSKTPTDAFLLPLMQRHSVQLWAASEGKKPKLIWQRQQSHFRESDRDGHLGSQLEYCNLLITVSKDGANVFIPYLRYSKGQIKLGGDIVSSNGKSHSLPRSVIEYDDRRYYFGWDGSTPTIGWVPHYSTSHPAKFRGLSFKTDLTVNLHAKPKPLSLLNVDKKVIRYSPHTLPSILDSSQLAFPDLHAGGLLSDTSISPQWMASDFYIQTPGDRGMPYMASNRNQFTSFGKGELILYNQEGKGLFKLNNQVNFALPLGGSKVVGSEIDRQPRSDFVHLHADASPFWQQEVYIFDLDKNSKTKLGIGYLGLPVPHNWYE